METRLVEHVGRGDLLDLVETGEVVTQDAMRSWGDSRTCQATVIRDILRGRLAADPDPRGLRLRGAKITGRLDLKNLRTEVNFELTDCLLEEGILAREASMASIGLRGCRLEHPLDATGLTCRLLDLSRATIIGHDKTEDGGAVCLRGARIGGHLDCTGASLRNDVGPALVGDGLQVGLGMFLSGRFAATGAGERGAVLLRGARIGRHLVCTKACLCNDSGPALSAKYLHVEQDIYLSGKFTGADENGTIHLSAAYIGGSLECDGAHLYNKSGPALHANRLRVGQVINLRNGFTATSGERNPANPDLGAVHLTGAHIGGSLHCEQAQLCNESGSALVADSLQTGRGLYLHKGFTATSRGDGVAVNLVRAQVGGTLFFDQAGIQHAAGLCRRLEVDGLTYTGVPQEISAKDWLNLLRDGTPGYAAQPYQHLAAGYRALGNDRQARETLIAQRDDQLARGETSRWEKLWGKITWFTLGYGYRPWKALWYLAVVLVVSCLLTWLLGAHGALAQTDKTAYQYSACTVIQQVSVGLDLNLPVGASVARAQCDLTTDSGSVTAFWLTVAG